MPVRGYFSRLPRFFGFGVVLALVTPEAATAQMWRHGPGPSAREVVQDLRDEGFRRISPPVLNHDAYVLDAIDPYNTPVRLIVSAHDGRILAVHRQRDAGWRGGGRHLPPVDDLDDDEPIFSSPPPQRPSRQATAPAPKAEPPRSANPALTPRTPTVTKTSPLAIPKDKDARGEKPKDGKAPVAAMPGTKTAPRVIPMAPAAVVPPKGTASGATPAPAATVPPASTTPAVPLAPTPPMVPPAALE